MKTIKGNIVDIQNHRIFKGEITIEAGIIKTIVEKEHNANGNAIAIEKPNMPIIGAKPPFDAASTKSVPTIGPVHENDTMAKANAIKKIPTMPPLLA